MFAQAFRSVRVDIEPLEDVLKNVLGKTGGNSRLLSALSTSSIQALLEGSSVQEYMANEEVLAQDSTFDYMLLIISGVFTMSHYGPSPPSPVCLLAPSNDSETFNPPARTTRMACQSTESSESDTSKDAIEDQMQRLVFPLVTIFCIWFAVHSVYKGGTCKDMLVVCRYPETSSLNSYFSCSSARTKSRFTFPPLSVMNSRLQVRRQSRCQMICLMNAHCLQTYSKKWYLGKF
jgi:hypothetical protein